MKRIYFVRHGQSVGNLGLVMQDEKTALTEKGIEQAKFIAKRCGSLPAQVLIASTMARAQQTAEIISKEISKDIIPCDLFVEQRKSSLIKKLAKDDPEVLKAEKEVIQNFTKPGYRHSDEENFDDLKKRADDALAYLEQRPEDEILVVTHGFFMRILAAYVVFGKDLTAVECQQFIRTFHMENTALSVFEFDPTRKHASWWVWIWNDHAHLGEIGDSKGK